MLALMGFTCLRLFSVTREGASAQTIAEGKRKKPVPAAEADVQAVE